MSSDGSTQIALEKTLGKKTLKHKRKSMCLFRSVDLVKIYKYFSFQFWVLNWGYADRSFVLFL